MSNTSVWEVHDKYNDVCPTLDTNRHQGRLCVQRTVTQRSAFNHVSGNDWQWKKHLLLLLFTDTNQSEFVIPAESWFICSLAKHLVTKLILFHTKKLSTFYSVIFRKLICICKLKIIENIKSKIFYNDKEANIKIL